MKVVKKQLVHPLAGSRPEALLRILWEHGGVSLRHAGQLSIITALCLLRWPSCIVESLIARNRIRNVRFDSPAVIIVGHWRSGTTFLHNILSRDPHFCYPNLVAAISPHDFLPAPWSPWFTRVLLRMLPATRVIDEVPLRPDLPFEEELPLASMNAPSFMNCIYFPRHLTRTFMREVMFAYQDGSAERWEEKMRYYLAKLSTIQPGDRLLLKNPANSARISQLLKILPNALFVHVHRNPFDVFRSSRAFYSRILPLLALQEYDPAEIDTHIMRSYELVMDKLREGLALVPDERICTVSYDELVARPLETVDRIYRDLQLSSFDTARSSINAFLTATPVKPASAVGLGAEIEAELRQRWQRHFDWLGYPVSNRAP